MRDLPEVDLRFVVLVTLLAAASVQATEVFADRGMPMDLRSFYLAGIAAQRDRDVYDLAELARLAKRTHVDGPLYPYVYAPPLAQVLEPFSRLSPTKAGRLWTWMSIACAALAIAVLVAPRDASQVPLALAEGLLVLNVLPFRNSLLLGQVNALVLMWVALALALHRRGRDVLAGVCIAAAALIKVTPAVFLLFLVARGRFRAVASAVGTAAVAFAASVAGHGLGPWERFAATAWGLGATSSGQELFARVGLSNFALPSVLLRCMPGSPELAHVLAVALVLALAAVALYLARRAAAPESEAASFGLFACAMLLASPLLYLHHLVYLAPALLPWLRAARASSRPWAYAAVCVLVALAGTDFPRHFEQTWLRDATSPLVTGANLWALAAATVLGVLLSARPHAAGA